MVLEALIVNGSIMASCSSKMIDPCRASINAEPPSRFFALGTGKVSRTPSCFVASKAAYRKHIRSQALVSLPKHKHVCGHAPSKKKTMIDQINVDSYRRSSFSECWLEDCICDIVKHIHEAPFLQLLFNSKDNSPTITSERQRVPAGDLSADESWKEMKNHVSKASPDGVILVHHLPDSPVISCEKEDGLVMTAKQIRDASNGGLKNENNGKDFWGVLVLGKTIAKSACYILETTSVASPFGTCTCFCLTKAQNFGPSWHDQIQSSWLLKTDIQQY